MGASSGRRAPSTITSPPPITATSAAPGYSRSSRISCAVASSGSMTRSAPRSWQSATADRLRSSLASMRTTVRGDAFDLCDTSGQQVDLVDRRDRHHQIGLGDPGGLHLRGMGSAPLHREHVEMFADVGALLGVALDHGDVVTLTAEPFGDVRADLTCADDDHIHVSILPGRRSNVVVGGGFFIRFGPGSSVLRIVARPLDGVRGRRRAPQAATPGRPISVDAVPYLALASAIAALVLAAYYFTWVKKADPGNDRMVDLMTEIQNGAQGLPPAGVHLGRRLRRRHGRPDRACSIGRLGARHLRVRRGSLGHRRLRRHDRGHDGQRPHHRGGQGRAGQGAAPRLPRRRRHGLHRRRLGPRRPDARLHPLRDGARDRQRRSRS